MQNTKGFTLLEMAVVILIVTILSGMAIYSYFNAAESARNVEAVVLWGQTKNFNVGRHMDAAKAQSLQARINKEANLKQFDVNLVCHERTDSRPCWEMVFVLKNPTARLQYKLVTVDNMTRLACVGINKEGQNYCFNQSGQDDEGGTVPVGEEQGFIIKG